MVPEKNLTKFEELLGGAKPFYSSVKIPKLKPKIIRKDLAPNWDSVF